MEFDLNYVLNIKKPIKIKGENFKFAFELAIANKIDLKGLDLKFVNLSNTNLQKADFRGANLKGANLVGAYLKGANLEEANLEEANLKRANFKRADLEGADLEGADLVGANFKRANLKGAYLKGADLKGADLKGADLKGAYLEGANNIPKINQSPLSILKIQENTLKAYKYTNISGESIFRSEGLIVGKEYTEENYDTDERNCCSRGLNISTLDWCLLNNNMDLNYLYYEVEFLPKDIIAVPINSNGKFRVKRLRVTKLLTKEYLQEYIKPMYPKK